MCSYNSSCTLDEYFLLKEVTKITKRTTEHYIYKYKDEIYILRHARYIKRECVEYKYRKELTDLYNCIPLKELSQKIGLSKGPLESKIEFMKKHNNMVYFEFKELDNIIYIIIDDELKALLNDYTSFIVKTTEDYTNINIKFYYHFCGYVLGFY